MREYLATRRVSVALLITSLVLVTVAPPVRAQTPVPDPVFVGAGDISTCANNGDEATATLLDGIEGTVFTLGDNAYEMGSSSEYTNCYDPTWGRHKSRTKPVPGNHEYYTPNGTGYYGYFGAAAGDPTKGYYSYDLGVWHIVALNSNDECTVISCASGSAQEQWLRADLASHAAACTLAYWHHPRFNSGSAHGNSIAVQPFWQALYDYGADVVLSGHEHTYERFSRQSPTGVADPAYGIREFVVGTGGKSHYTFGNPKPNSEVRNNDTDGVLKLTLHPNGYDWEFIPVSGQTFTDSGSESCHSMPPGVGGEVALTTVAPSSNVVPTVPSNAPAPVESEDDSSGIPGYWFIVAAVALGLAAAGALIIARRRA